MYEAFAIYGGIPTAQTPADRGAPYLILLRGEKAPVQCSLSEMDNWLLIQSGFTELVPPSKRVIPQDRPGRWLRRGGRRCRNNRRKS